MTVESALAADLDLLESVQPQPREQATETAKDMKYVRERQMIIRSNGLPCLFFRLC